MHAVSTIRCRSRALAAAALVMCASAALVAVAAAPAQDLQSRLDQKRAKLDQAKAHEGVLSTTIQRYTDQIETLAGQVATLQNREAAVQRDLDSAQTELEADKERLTVLRVRLHRSAKLLRKRLVAIYRSDEPDVLAVILESEGFDDLISRYEYLRTIENQDSTIVSRVRNLRDETRTTVDRVRSLRDELAAKRDELARTRRELESRQSALNAVRSDKRQALSQVQQEEAGLDRGIERIQGQIAAQLQAAAASDTSAAPATLPAGPVQGVSSAGLIWPVNGVITSPYGPRWGGFHPGLDIGAPTGTPIRAAKSGSIVLAGWTGGYGNYTCINHGGGLSTCYAHQSSYAVTSGNVSQGQVIGYVGSTGFSTGPHLHFEVRINGQPVDPMGYLS